MIQVITKAITMFCSPVETLCCEDSFVECEKGYFDCPHCRMRHNSDRVDMLNQSVSAGFSTVGAEIGATFSKFVKSGTVIVEIGWPIPALQAP